MYERGFNPWVNWMTVSLGCTSAADASDVNSSATLARRSRVTGDERAADFIGLRACYWSACTPGSTKGNACPQLSALPAGNKVIGPVRA